MKVEGKSDLLNIIMSNLDKEGDKIEVKLIDDGQGLLNKPKFEVKK